MGIATKSWAHNTHLAVFVCAIMCNSMRRDAQLCDLMRFNAIVCDCLRFKVENASKKEALLSASRFRAFARKLVFTAKVAVEAIPVGQIVQRFIEQRFRNLDTTEQAKRAE